MQPFIYNMLIGRQFPLRLMFYLAESNFTWNAFYTQTLWKFAIPIPLQWTMIIRARTYRTQRKWNVLGNFHPIRCFDWQIANSKWISINLSTRIVCVCVLLKEFIEWITIEMKRFIRVSVCVKAALRYHIADNNESDPMEEIQSECQRPRRPKRNKK